VEEREGSGVKHGDPITIVLKHPENVGLDGRLVHTDVWIWFHHRRSEVREDTFEANKDDRPLHRISDRGVTWLPGHVPLDGPEAKELVRHAEEADVLRSSVELAKG
jgi:hypothetical protein